MGNTPKKYIMKRILAIILAVSIVSCLAGCSKVTPSLLTEKVTEMIDLSVDRDTESRYALLYPDVTDIDTYRITTEMIDDYFPVTEGYTLELQQWNITKGVNNKTEIHEGEYKAEFDGNVFYINAVWRSDSDGEGFVRFWVVSEEEWNDAQKQ